jgi:hypothetical protein
VIHTALPDFVAGIFREMSVAPQTRAHLCQKCNVPDAAINKAHQ